MRLFLLLSGLMGFTGVALGAFGAHGLKSRLAELPDLTQRLDWWQTAAHYHLVHALALAVAGVAASRGGGVPATTAGYAFLIGIVLFSGSLYTMTLTGLRTLGAVAPVGGLAFLVGWACLVVAALRLP